MTLLTALRRWLPVALLLAVLGCLLVATPATSPVASAGASASGHIAQAVDSGLVLASQPQPSRGTEGGAAAAPGSSRGDAADCADASVPSASGASSAADVEVDARREAGVTDAHSALAEARGLNRAVAVPVGLTVAALSVRRT